MTISNEGQAPVAQASSSLHPDSNTNGGESTTAAAKKLHGRAFYESIGSPKFVLAPMVDQSEFVSSASWITVEQSVELIM
jgi:tRNA-dihydrouridine synthase 1